jgi:hypothetical protein
MAFNFPSLPNRDPPVAQLSERLKTGRPIPAYFYGNVIGQARLAGCMVVERLNELI